MTEPSPSGRDGRLRVLFLCVANSARSQMAEGLARAWFSSTLEASSAGSSPAGVNPFAVAALAELGIDLGGQRSTSVQDVEASEIDVVITLCAEEVCPAFLGEARRLHWPLDDPAGPGHELEPEATRERFRVTRERIAERLRREFGGG